MIDEDELNRVIAIEGSIEARLAALLTPAKTPVIDRLNMVRNFSAFKDGWEFTVYPVVEGQKFRLDGFLPSELLFNDYAVAIVMAGFYEWLLIMQTEYWRDWIKRRDEGR